jgi:TRAP-type C4-dicarboxylate transport system permease small subunit
MQALDDRICAATRWIAALGLLALFLNSMAVVVDVLLRALLSAPIDKLSDVSSVIFFTAAACCIPSATAARRHITIRALEGLPWPRVREAINGLAGTVTAIILGLLAWQAMVSAAEMAANGRTLSQIPVRVAPFWYFVAACMVLSALIQVFIVIRHASAALGGGASKAGAATDGDGKIL